MATFGTWLRVQIGRDDETGELAQAIAGSTQKLRGNSPQTIKKWLEENQDIDTGWALPRLAAAEADYRRQRGADQGEPVQGATQPRTVPLITEGDEPVGELITTRQLAKEVRGLLEEVLANQWIIMSHLGLSPAGQDGPIPWDELFGQADFAAPEDGEFVPGGEPELGEQG